MSGQDRGRRVDEDDREAGAERARPNLPGRGRAARSGLVAQRGGQTTAYSPGACHCHTTLLASTFAPAVTVPGLAEP